MERAHGRKRVGVALGMVLACMLLAWCPRALALNPALDVSQYAHTAWKVRDGFSKGVISSIAQTPDGYLWLGTEFGLLRFDGVRSVPWQPPPDQPLPSSEITSLLVSRDGTLWIGTSKGLASWKGGKLTQYPELAGQRIARLLEDRDGTVWAGGLSFPPPGKLCAIHNGSVQCYGEDGSLGYGVVDLYEDSKGNLWAGALGGLWRWQPGPPQFYPLPDESNGIQGLGEDEDGALLIGIHGGLSRFVDGKTEAYPFPAMMPKFKAQRLLRDRDGGLWIGTLGRGVVHVHQGRTDVFSSSDGLSGDIVQSFFEDREGNIWVGTINGLDRFRDFAVATFSINQGLSNAVVVSVLAARDGSVWFGTLGGLNRWKNGQVSVFGNGSAQNKRGGNAVVGNGKQGESLTALITHSLFQDDRGRVWISTRRGIGYLENDRIVYISGVPGGLVHAIAEDTGENLWIANQELGLFRLRPASEIQQIPWATLGHRDPGLALATDPLQGGLWVGFFQGGIAYFKDGQVRASYAAADGLGAGHINQLRVEQDGTLWAATEGGLSRLKNGRIATLSSQNGLPCDAVHWLMEDDDHAFWLYTACGLVRIARTELDAWAAAVDKDKEATPTIQVAVFDSADGVRSRATAGGFGPHVARSSDGRLWFLPLDGVSVVDPRHLPFNHLPPPVHIEQITADRKTYNATAAANGQVPLPALLRDLEIDYTALSLAAPEKVLFRYKLENWDRDWQDAGTRRQAFYTSLPPGTYRFRVMACNNSGVWNEEGTFLDFSIAPAFYQTTWFRALCVAAVMAVLAALYRLRLRQVARHFNLRMEERVGERTRLARELHDTLLQSFQGVLMKFHAVTYLIADRPEAQQTLERVVEQARQAIAEGRDAVYALRASTVITNDLARAINQLGEELAAAHTGQPGPAFCVAVEGRSRDLPPLVRDEVYRIAGEALRNAFRHAQATRIEVEIRYGKRRLRLRVRDDGKGLDPQVLAAGGRVGHYGLHGMRERAELVKGKLAVWSEVDAGTEVELTIPAAVAYAKVPAGRRAMSSGKGR